MMKKSLVIEYSETPLAVDVHIFKILQCLFYLKIVHHIQESNCIQDSNIFKFIRKTLHSKQQFHAVIKLETDTRCHTLTE